MNKKLQPIEELKRLLAEDKKEVKAKKPLLEGYLSDEDFDVTYDDVEDEEQTESGDMMAEKKGILPIKKEIDQIRQIALQTIARLAENPTSESYQMMKKIWIMCDKAIESALNPNEGK